MAVIRNGWTAAELDSIGATTNLRLASRRPDGSLRPYVTIWVVRLGDQLYVRSAYGPDNPWYRRARASGRGAIKAGGVESEVEFVDASIDTAADVDAAYHAKYDQFGAPIVATVVGDHAHPLTLRLVPADDSP